MKIVKELIGDITVEDALDEPAAISMHIAKRRKESYAKFYREEEWRSRCNRNWDVPHIAHIFLDFWDGVELSSMEQDRIC